MTRVRLRNLLIAIAVLALLLKDVEVRSYPASVVSMTDWGGDLYWRGHLFASAAKEQGFLFTGKGSHYRVTLGTASNNVEVVVRIGQ